MKRTVLLLAVAAFLAPTASLPHSSRTDSYGCHNETATGTYHCHSGTFAGRSFPSQEAMLRELSSTTPTAPSSAYSREEWLPDWADVDGDCQNTRHEVLIAESAIPVTLSSSGCTVVAGLWHDPYTGLTFTNPADVDIDHVVALSEAHQSGGSLWTTAQKQAFANDRTNPLVLIAVDDGTNSAKGDKDPAEWLPPNAAYH